uniref:G-protein coupled receptors family 2 profile 2 domain-containing protein n=1 Tax=Heliothis virescens TaxID=7102 RepID=A0A2A4J1F0_HELVI
MARGKIPQDTLYCNATYDGFLCWPPTPAGETSYQHCPDIRLSDARKFAYRRCGADGLWVGRHLNVTSSIGWTNYTPCFPALVQNLFDKVYDDEAEAQIKFETAANTRTLEIIGYTLSFLSNLGSIWIFSVYPALHNRRTIIHRNLFCALLTETTVRIWLYWNQVEYIIGNKEQVEDNLWRRIEKIPNVCESFYVLLEYSRLVVYSWMFIEGIFLNTLVSANTLRNEIPILYFYIGGWVTPISLVAVWVSVVSSHYSDDNVTSCWYGYNYLPSYYIIQGPIFAILGINFLFLGSIMKVIVTKLRRTNDSELKKMKKTVRAALILLPLLGICNVFNLIEYPLDGSSIGFAIWAYVTHFFRSFQGVLISTIYCFRNAEVIKVISKAWERRRCCPRRRRRKPPNFPPRRTRPIFYITDDEGNEQIQMTMLPYRRPSTSVIDAEAGPSNVNYITDDEGNEQIQMTMLPYRRPSTSVIDAEAGPSNVNAPAFSEVTVHVPTDNLPMTNLLENIERRRHSSELALRVTQPESGRIPGFHQYNCNTLHRYHKTTLHTVPRARRNQFYRPGLVGHGTRMGRLSISSCI